jgi:hypothetical protein
MVPPAPAALVTPGINDDEQENDKADRQQRQCARLVMPQLLKVTGNLADNHALTIYTMPGKKPKSPHPSITRSSARMSSHYAFLLQPFDDPSSMVFSYWGPSPMLVDPMKVERRPKPEIRCLNQSVPSAAASVFGLRVSDFGGTSAYF